MVYALILGRKGSVGFPGKNLYPVCGKPLAYYPMKAALASTNIVKYISQQTMENSWIWRNKIPWK